MWKAFKKGTLEEVQVGDKIYSERDDPGYYEINHFMPPHKPASSGKVSVYELNAEDERAEWTSVYYIGVIGCEYRWTGDNPPPW